MKKKKKGNITKGAPQAIILSILIHAGLFLLAGMLVIFTVVKQKEVEFEPPKAVQRPKMKLKKPKVKIKKSSKPKSTTRIVTKQSRASMPDIQLPEMSGMGDGLGEGVAGGFDMMPDLSEVTLFGGGQSIGNDFVGTFYDFKRDRQGRSIQMGEDQFKNEVRKFVKSGWNRSHLGKYYQSPNKLYATTIMVPAVPSYTAPTAFNEPDTIGYAWLVHYEGQLIHHEDITFRFWGQGDDILVVRVDGEIVLNASWPGGSYDSYFIAGEWQSSAKGDRQHYMGNNLARGGDWITLEAGKPKEMEVIIGEVPGGGFCAMLAVQEKGVEYPRSRHGAPIHPMFKTEEPSYDLLDVIYRDLVVDEVSLTNGPVFRDYVATVKSGESAGTVDRAVEPMAGAPAEINEEPVSRMTAWTTVSGRNFEAEYITTIGGKMTFKTAQGQRVTIPYTELSEDDRKRIELNNPPPISIDFIKRSKTILNRYKLSPAELRWGRYPPRVNDYEFGARVKLTGVQSYSHTLTIEYFAVAKELLGGKYILIDRKKSTFVPDVENGYSHSFMGDRTIEFREYTYEGTRRGSEYAENLVTVTDERGKIIAHSTSGRWLLENIANLQKLPMGSYMDKTCTRVHPTSPKRTRY